MINMLLHVIVKCHFMQYASCLVISKMSEVPFLVVCKLSSDFEDE